MVISIVAYLFLAFMLADFVLKGEALEFFIFIAKIFACSRNLFPSVAGCGAIYEEKALAID